MPACIFFALPVFFPKKEAYPTAFWIPLLMTMQQASVHPSIEPFLFKHQIALENLPERVLARIREHCQPRLFSDGEVMFQQGSYPKGAFLLQSGLVKISQSTFQGHRQIVYVYTKGDLVGYRQLMTAEAYPIEATALGKVEADFVNASAFAQLIREEPQFAHNLLVALSHEFSVWVNRITFFMRYPVRSRLAIALLTLERQFMEAGKMQRAIIISRTDLADLIGATLETTVRTLSEFKAKGWVKALGRRIWLTAPEELAAVANAS